MTEPQQARIARAETDPAAPIRALAAQGGAGVLAILTDVTGRFYRPTGSLLALLPDGRRVGSLSSGCVEADLVLHARQARQSGRPRKLRYGVGSDNFDIQLPCGGGISVLLLPDPNGPALQDLCRRLDNRQPCTLLTDPETGTIEVTEDAGDRPNMIARPFEPDTRFLVIGSGPEATTFATMTAAAGFDTLLVSHDDETLDTASAAGLATRRLTGPNLPGDVEPDRWTAVTLFFHDHGWEAGLLRDVLRTGAAYVGAQGSPRAQGARIAALLEMGVNEADIDRIHGPMGLVPSARSPRMLAASVLAQVMAEMPDR